MQAYVHCEHGELELGLQCAEQSLGICEAVMLIVYIYYVYVQCLSANLACHYERRIHCLPLAPEDCWCFTGVRV